MPVPTNLSDLSTTAASNSPAATDTLSTTDDYLRALSAILAKVGDGTNALVSPSFTTSVVTASTTFAVFNATATTVNAFGAATTLNLGNAAGATSLLGTLNVAGNFSVATSKFTVNASTGAAVFAGAVSGITTLSASGPITSLKAHSGTLSLQPRIQIKNATAGTTFTGRYQFVDGDGNEGWEVATNAAVGSGYLEFNEGATNRAYFSPGGGLTVAGAISGTTGKFGGAENLKIWTYAHVITAAEITATLVNATITAVNTSNVRGLQITYRNAAGIVYTDAYATALTKYGSARMSSTTNVEIGLGVGAAANDVIYIVVLEAF
ncbi:MAG: hypothetical protein QX199_19700 [Methylococcaceae bacterium]